MVIGITHFYQLATPECDPECSAQPAFPRGFSAFNEPVADVVASSSDS